MKLDEKRIETALNCPAPSEQRIKKIAEKAREKKGLTLEETGELLAARRDNEKIFESARAIKQEIYGSRIVLFAPLYLSSYCINDCAYCGFRSSNKTPRKRLTIEEIREQTTQLEKMGHKRLLLEAGEHPDNTIEYVRDAIKAIYATKGTRGESIRRVNVNIAATTKENYAILKEAGIGTYQLFQETYHKPTFEKLHCGPKADYCRQINAAEIAFSAGIDDYGLGALFGLYDWKYEVLSLIAHAQKLEEGLGVGPHTISVPRYKPAAGATLEPFVMSDEDFLRAIAILRLAVPYTGMILSTRETASLRHKAFELGISQASAASIVEPGGYGKSKATTQQQAPANEAKQFKISDERSLEEVVQALCRQGLLPSFCTACYRRERTGEDFMELAKNGKINEFCLPNALLTFKEYLEDHASPQTRAEGEKTIRNQLAQLQNTPENTRIETIARLKRIEQGERDLYF